MIEDSWISKSWPNGMEKWKYNFQLTDFGFPHVDSIRQWVAENPKGRWFGPMGYISCNCEKDALMVVLRWS